MVTTTSSNDAINVLVNAAKNYGFIKFIGSKAEIIARETGQMLADENAKSVSHRYPSETVTAIDFEFSDIASPEFPMGVITAVQYYRYQSCEHPGWASSDACELCERLIEAAISRMDGFKQFREEAWRR